MTCRPHAALKPLALASILVTNTMTACGTTEVCACTPGAATAVVFGRVTSPEGAGVPGARVSVVPRTGPDCPEAFVEGTAISEGGTIFRDPGLFRVVVLSAVEVTGACLAVQAQPPLDSAGLNASSVEPVTLDVTFTEVPDSTAVALVLTR